MRKNFSLHWKSSTQPRKQRKFRKNAPLHIKKNFMNVHISKELRLKYKKRALQIKKGDTVKIIRGKYKKKIGKVERVSLRRLKVFVENIQTTKRDGTKVFVPLEPSNMIITDAQIEDKKRKEKLERK